MPSESLAYCDQALRQAKEGDPYAFEDLQKCLEISVRRFALRLLGRSNSLDEIVQDSFLALYMNLGKVATVDHLRPFIFTVVRNLCYDELRRRNRYQIVSIDDDSKDFDLSFQGPSPEDEATWLLLYSQVQQKMQSLSELQRQTLILFVEEDMSHEQIAEIMGTDIGTVKSRIHYGRKRLLRSLNRDTRKALGINEVEE